MAENENNPANIEGGLGVGAGDDGLRLKASIEMDRRAIAHGWLINRGGLGLNAEKMAALIDRNYSRGMVTEDDRALASLTRNVVAAVAQVMEQEKIDLKIPTRLEHTSGGKPLSERNDLEALAFAAFMRDVARASESSVGDVPTNGKAQSLVQD